MRILLVLLLLLLLPRHSAADGAQVKQGAGGVFPLSNRDIQMVWETIDVTGLQEGPMGDDSTLMVTVTYLFRNRTGQALSLDMGFPITWDQAEFYSQGSGCMNRSTESSVSDFVVTVDGAEVKATLRPGRKKIRTGCLKDAAYAQEQERDEQASKRGPPYHEFYVWPVSFAPHQEHTLINRYRYNTYTKHRAYDWRQFEYVLKTGALWRGPIERVTIRAHFGDRVWVGGLDGRSEVDTQMQPGGSLESFEADPFKFVMDVRSVTPAGARAARLPDGTSELRWELRNYKPSEDISIHYLTARSAREQVKAAIERIDLAKASQVTLTRAHDTLLALYGCEFADPKVQGRFAVKGWYIVDRQNARERAAKDPLLQAIAARLKTLAPAPTP
ncbi:MAG TPA: DUF4424 family protein [Pseudomonadota bacterium]|nr:DUF4424 family protein [Pseudomonadota bacterium]